MLYFSFKKSLNYSANSNHLRTHTYNFYKSVRWKALCYIQSTEGFRLFFPIIIYFLLKSLESFELEQVLLSTCQESRLPLIYKAM